jgi:hypothetical protein
VGEEGILPASASADGSASGSWKHFGYEAGAVAASIRGSPFVTPAQSGPAAGFFLLRGVLTDLQNPGGDRTGVTTDPFQVAEKDGLDAQNGCLTAFFSYLLCPIPIFAIVIQRAVYVSAAQ